MLSVFAAHRSSGATFVIYTNDFEAYSNVATNLADETDADPAGGEWNIFDDNPLGNAAGSGVQVINWLSHSGSKSLLLRSSSEAQVYLSNTRSGTSYQLDFWVHAVRGAGDRNWYVLLRGMGADSNGDDYLAYRTDRSTSSNIFYFDGIGPGAAAFIDTGADHVDNQWQHHRLVFDTAAQKCTIYVDDMVTPVVVNGDLARPDVAVPSLLILRHEGNSADDGYCAIDDVRFAVEGSVDLSSTFTEGFEGYPARINPGDDADPQGPWITVEVDGNGSGRPLAHGKVQVVSTNEVMPRSGTNCLKLESGQRAGVSFAWGETPQSDVQITWWARVPASVQGTVANYLRMSLYGVEGASSYSGDCALLGYGSRDAVVGDATSLTYFTTAWVDTGIDYTPDEWEQYRMTSHTSQGTYTIIKNPSGASPEVIVDRAPFIGSAANWGPMFLAAWSSSNGTNHPPVYVDDIEIKSLVSIPDPLPDPYTVVFEGNRFTNVTILKVGGPIGKMAVDPRDNTSIIFAVDGTGGGIFQAQKIASGNWSVNSQPLVSGLDRPSGLAVDGQGTIWWTHDFTMSLRRLKAPWESNVMEEIISNFGNAETDDDPIDVTIAPATFNGSLGQSNMVVVADRGSDGDAFNAVYLVDPATMMLNQTNYNTFLVSPSATDLGGGNLNAIAPLAQYGEVVTLNADSFITAIDANGALRYIIPTTLYSNPFEPISPTALATDPMTDRLWIADDLLDEVWSVDPNPSGQTADQKELSFPLTNPSRTDLQIDFHDPGMTFAPNGAFMVLSDASTQNGGGRLLIFHNEPISVPVYSITRIERVGGTVELEWESAGGVTYNVLRGTNITDTAGFVNISGDLTSTQFTDAAPLPGQAFYRVQAKQ